jgi:RNA polymerase sigma-70 factor (ECF subfamily)
VVARPFRDREGMSHTSLSLLERLRQQPDAESWQRLVAVYTTLVSGWLRRYEVPAADVEDLTQEILTVLVRELPQFRHNQRPGAFRAWLRTITVHRLRDFWRRRNTRPAVGEADFGRSLDQLEDPRSALSERWDREHDRHVARRLMELIEPEFEPKTWQAFRRTALEGARAAQVAAELGLSANAVLIAKSRVLQRLRAEARGLTD